VVVARQRAEWSIEKWSFTGGVFVGGEPVGMQDLSAERFRALKRVGTGSWLGRAHQGQGLGKEMRSANLHLAFAGLGALEAHSGAWADNPRSHGVSAAMGYVRRGLPFRHLYLHLDRATWEKRRRQDISIEGLESCLEMFFGESA
jgi:RimJ/RimL family protein N-acetyltransferase